MNEQKRIIKIMYIIMAAIIVIGAIIVLTKGFKIELNYMSRNKIILSNNTEIDKAKIEEIAKEVLGNKQVRVQELERFSNAVEVVSTEITEEEKSNIINKVNESLGISISNDDVTITSIPNTRIRDILKPYIVPAIITFTLVLLYFVAVYHKLGLKYVLLRGVVIPIVVELFFYAIVALTRIPFGMITNAIAIGIYIISIKCIGTLFQNKKEEKPKEQKEND